VESLLGEAEVSSLQSRVPVRKGYNFLSDCWIALNFLQEFPEAFFFRVHVELLLDEAEVSTLETRVPVRKGHNFDPTVGSPSNFYRSFRKPFSLE
jgi:hypothetical protein